MTAIEQCSGQKTVVFMNSQQNTYTSSRQKKISAWSLRRWVSLSEDLFVVETAWKE